MDMDAIRESFLAGQAERLARLALRNQILLVGTIVWGCLLLFWTLYSFLRFYRTLQNAAAGAGDIPFTCSRCGASFRLPAAYLGKHPFLPQKKVTVSSFGAGGAVRLSRRLHCPRCGRKAWCRQDLAAQAPAGRQALAAAVQKSLPRFLAGGAVLFAAGLLFFSAVRLILG